MLLFSGAGCQSGKKVVKVTGKVTRNGQPVPNLSLDFTPANGRPSWGNTDANGDYKLLYTFKQEGAEVDTHKVVIGFMPGSVQETNDIATGRKKVSVDRAEILKKYGDRANPGIKITITEDGKPVDIKLD